MTKVSDSSLAVYIENIKNNKPKDMFIMSSIVSRCVIDYINNNIDMIHNIYIEDNYISIDDILEHTHVYIEAYNRYMSEEQIEKLKNSIGV